MTESCCASPPAEIGGGGHGSSEDIWMKRKLQSRRGASITFALLLFLVCAVIGSVVLIAGTAAAGRVAGLAKSDQRYYSVTSAARLFEEKFDETNITIERTHTYSKIASTPITVYATTGAVSYGETQIKDPIPPDDDYTDVLSNSGMTTAEVNLDSSAVRPRDMLEYFARRLVYGDGTPGATSWEKDFPAITAPEKKNFVLSGVDGLSVDVKATLNTNGALTLLFTNTNDGDGKYMPFTLEMVMSADIDNSTSQTENAGEPGRIGNTVNVVTDYKVVKTTSITWRVVSLEVKEGAA